MYRDELADAKLDNGLPANGRRGPGDEPQMGRTKINWWPALVATALFALAGCGGDSGSSAQPLTAALTCDDSIKTGFKPDDQTTVLLVKAFAKGDPLVLSGSATAQTPKAANDMCLVKLNVGPGNPGPADAPSTSAGIGIEVWLPKPANWNKRFHAIGLGGWSGGNHGSIVAIGSLEPASVAGIEGAVSASTDAGHRGEAADASWAMRPDGTLNTTLLKDFSVRGAHELAVKAKALATQYYGSAPQYSYHEGASGGGRLGMSLAQYNPDDYDGIISVYPSQNLTRLTTGELYPQILFQRELGGVPMTTAQQDLVSNAAISACDLVGGQHLGYLIEPSQCRYDPTIDLSVLCVADGGANATSACVTLKQASVINRIWFGMTVDGTAPSPGADNGWNMTRDSKHLWWGQARGTSLYGATFAGFLNGLTSPNGPFPVASDVVALELQNPTLAEPTFVNASGNGTSGWKSLTYSQLANAYDRGLALQGALGNVNTDNPDLSTFKKSGGKLVVWHGLADELIPAQGSIDYHNRVVSHMGGLVNVQDFYRLYLVPGVGHGSPNGTSNPNATPPMPTQAQMYQLAVDWVEKGIAPDRVDISTPPNVTSARSMPICVYPKKITHVSGDPRVAASYTCS